MEVTHEKKNVESSCEKTGLSHREGAGTTMLRSGCGSQITVKIIVALGNKKDNIFLATSINCSAGMLTNLK